MTKITRAERGNIKVLVLMGGWSSEREVSLNSGANCYQALLNAGWDAHAYDMNGSLLDLVEALQKYQPDLVFNALHGTYGEDGAIPGLLKMMKIAFTYSDIAASAVAMDKIMTKQMLAPLGIKFAESYAVTHHVIDNNNPQTIAEICTKVPMDLPYVLKPMREGSSKGIYMVGVEGYPDMSEEKIMPQAYMAERYIDGRELTISVLDGYGALGVTELVPKSGFYDYDAKYQDGMTAHYCPADISDELQAHAMQQAELAHQTLGCRQVSRSDFRYSLADNQLYFLEINTHPGMTELSLVPEQARLHGMDFEALCNYLVEGALHDSEQVTS